MNKKGAAQDLADAVNKNPFNHFALLNLVLITDSWTDGAREERVLLSIGKILPQSQFVLFCLAAHHERSHQPQLALAALNKILKINPENEAALAGSALAEILRGNLELGIKNARRALDINPFSEQAHSAILLLDYPGETACYRDIMKGVRIKSSADPVSIASTPPLWVYDGSTFTSGM